MLENQQLTRSFLRPGRVLSYRWLLVFIESSSVTNQYSEPERVISSVNVSEPIPGKRVRMCPFFRGVSKCVHKMVTFESSINRNSY